MAKVADFCSPKKVSSEAFQNADRESKGFLTREDYKVAVIEVLGYKPSRYELDSVWRAYAGCHGNEEGLSKDAFVSIMTKRLEQKDVDEMIRQVFVSFDVHLNSFLTLEGCKRVFGEVVPLIKAEQIERWFQEADSNNDGRITYRDFELMMKSHTILNPSII